MFLQWPGDTIQPQVGSEWAAHIAADLAGGDDDQENAKFCPPGLGAMS